MDVLFCHSRSFRFTSAQISCPDTIDEYELPTNDKRFLDLGTCKHFYYLPTVSKVQGECTYYQVKS